MAAYANSADMTARFDERTLKELVVDDNTPETNLATNVKMTAALADATGAIDAALLVGQMYDPDDLDALTDESLAYLKRITCEIALCYLVRRRPEKYGKASKEIKENVDAILDQFRSGVRVFDIDANRQAGLPTVDGLTVVQYQGLGLHRDISHMYPRRRLPVGRGT